MSYPEKKSHLRYSSTLNYNFTQSSKRTFLSYRLVRSYILKNVLRCCVLNAYSLLKRKRVEQRIQKQQILRNIL